MSYPNFGKVKTIVFPLEYDFVMSLSSVPFYEFCDIYKKRYGVDPSEFITLEDGWINVNSYVLVQNLSDTYAGLAKGEILPYFKTSGDTAWSSGENDGIFTILIGNDNLGYGITFTLSKDDDPNLKWVLISGTEF